MFDLRFESELILLSIDVELDFSDSYIDVCICYAQERPTQDERHLGVDFHVENDEVDSNEEILNLDRLLFPRGSEPFGQLVANTWQ